MKWTVDGKPQKSVAIDREKSYPSEDSVIDRSNAQTVLFFADHEIALIVFGRLRNVQTAKVYLPEDMIRDDEYMAFYIEECLMTSEPFGTVWDPDEPWDDAKFQDILHKLYMDLDVKLDLLPGITANRMRLERFSSWYANGLGSESKYERELERILKTSSTSILNLNQAERIQERYAAMQAFNPRSLFHRYGSSREWYKKTWDFAPKDAKTGPRGIRFWLDQRGVGPGHMAQRILSQGNLAH